MGIFIIKNISTIFINISVFFAETIIVSSSSWFNSHQRYQEPVLWHLTHHQRSHLSFTSWLTPVNINLPTSQFKGPAQSKSNSGSSRKTITNIISLHMVADATCKNRTPHPKPPWDLSEAFWISANSFSFFLCSFFSFSSWPCYFLSSMYFFWTNQRFCFSLGVINAFWSIFLVELPFPP